MEKLIMSTDDEKPEEAKKDDVADTDAEIPIAALDKVVGGKASIGPQPKPSQPPSPTPSY
jgi:hypothetical protein